MAKTNVELQQEYNERQKELKLCKLADWVPIERKAEIRAWLRDVKEEYLEGLDDD